MRNRIERLRMWLLGGAVLLLLVIVAFVGIARYMSHRFLAGLPARLGVNIKSETNGFTYSQSDGPKGRTLYTIHAAKESEYTNGTVMLHDVTMVLYGKNGDRSDRISGDEFEYDQNAGVVRAMGVVHIDLEAAAPPAGGGRPGTGEAQMLHATTSGLVYLQKLGVAATSGPIQFQLGEMTGRATGADYSTDTGLLMLHSAVKMTGIAGGRPVSLTASSAELDNRSEETFLTRARYVSLGETVQAEQATLHTRPDGSLTRVEAQGEVTAEAQGGTVTAQRADVLLGAQSQPQSAVMTGGVVYSASTSLRQTKGKADEATLAFDAEGQPEHAELTGAVQMTERTRMAEEQGPWVERELTAAKVDAALARAGAGRTEVQDVDASGGARLTMVSQAGLASAVGGRTGKVDTTGGKAGTTELAGDELKAHLVPGPGGQGSPQVEWVLASGHTLLRQVSQDGVEQSSSGDRLDARFRTLVTNTATARGMGAAQGDASSSVGARSKAGIKGGTGIKGAKAGALGGGELLSAVQQGHVVMTRRAPVGAARQAAGAPGGRVRTGVGGSGGGGYEEEQASAQRAVYDGGLDRVTLAGDVQLTDLGGMLWANQVVFERGTGDAQASGAVKVNYVQAGVQDGAQQAEPVHILADRASLNHASDVATFYGGPARLWQGGSQVEAPVLVLDRAERRLTAEGAAAEPAGQSGPAQVHTVLVSMNGAATSPGPGQGAERQAAATPRAGARQPQQPQAVRIASRRLVYSDTLREAEFTGGVRAESEDGTLLAHQATVYLQAARVAGARAADHAGVGTEGGALSGRGSLLSGAGGPLSGTRSSLSLDGSIEQVVATGHVEIEQPGRSASGERLIYTASDRLFVLTGGPGARPRLVDSQRGATITGAALQFHSGDDSVVVTSANGAGGRVRTDTPVKH